MKLRIRRFVTELESGVSRVPGLVVYAYHRILDSAEAAKNPFDDGVVTCSPKEFSWQLEQIASRRTVISLDEVLHAIVRNGVLPERATLLTFDDGYADNYTNAVPILKKLGLTAVFFVTTEGVHGRHVGWWDRLSYFLKHAPTGRYDIARDLTIDLRSTSSAARRGAATFALQEIKQRHLREADAVVERLFEKAGVAPPSMSTESSSLINADELRHMCEMGMSIGSHTVTHRALSLLSRREQMEELGRSKEILQATLGCAITSIAYPYGGKRFYSEETVRVAGQCGYEAGFSFNSIAPGGTNWSAYPLEIDRCVPPKSWSRRLREKCGTAVSRRRGDPSVGA